MFVDSTHSPQAGLRSVGNNKTRKVVFYGNPLLEICGTGAAKQECRWITVPWDFCRVGRPLKSWSRASKWGNKWGENCLKDSVQSLTRVQLFATPCTAACQASLFITNSRSPPKPTSIESVMPSNHIILCCPLLLLPSILPSIRVFTNESALRIRWPKYWSFSFNISPSSKHPRLISFRMDWLDLLSVQGTLKSLLQHHSSKASILRRSAFFTVQLSHPYMTTGKP